MGIDQIFGDLYTAFGLENIYGSGPGELADYLWGNASKMVTTNQFIGIGFLTLGISFAVFLIYYYVLGHLFQKPSWGNWITWCIALAVNGLCGFIAGWQWTLSDLYAGKMLTLDPTTNVQVDLPIDEINCLQFGGANVIIAIFFFFLLSLFFKWWSRDYSHIPV